jgi:hypothetical protein
LLHELHPSAAAVATTQGHHRDITGLTLIRKGIAGRETIAETRPAAAGFNPRAARRFARAGRVSPLPRLAGFENVRADVWDT